MRRTQWLRIMAVGVAALALVVSACDDDSGSDSTDDMGGSGDELTGEPIKIMVMGNFELSGSEYSQVPEAAQAAAAAIEADGGLNGSPFEIIVCNTASANDGTACGRQAVEENVVATVGTFSTFAPQYLPILAEAGIPQVAPYPLDFSDYQSEINYPLFGGALAITAGMGAELSDEGAETINVSYLDIGAGAFAAELVAMGTEPRGTEIVSTTPVPDDTVEFSSVAASATDGDPDGIAVLVATAEGPGYLRSLSQTGYDGLVAMATTSITPADLEELGDIVEGMLVPTVFLPASFEGNEAVDQFNAEMDEYAPDASRDDSAQNAWLGMHLIADIMEGRGRVTSAKLIDALDTSGDIDLGLMPPINFQQGLEIPELAPGLELRIFSSSVVYTVIEDGVPVALNDGEFVEVLEG